jgi:hypothetical protein
MLQLALLDKFNILTVVKISCGLVSELFSVLALARPLPKQVKFCPEKSAFSRKNVEGSGLVLEATSYIEGGWCVKRQHVGTTQRYTLLKAKSLSLRMTTHKMIGYAGYSWIRQTWLLWTH